MYEIRLTRVSAPDHNTDLDPSGRKGYYIWAPNLAKCVVRVPNMQNWPAGTYVDLQVWKVWDKHGHQVPTPGPGCEVIRYMLVPGGIKYVRTYQHP